MLCGLIMCNGSLGAKGENSLSPMSPNPRVGHSTIATTLFGDDGRDGEDAFPSEK
jgi:hypothetical protein